MWPLTRESGARTPSTATLVGVASRVPALRASRCPSPSLDFGERELFHTGCRGSVRSRGMGEWHCEAGLCTFGTAEV
ncbi:hypothetical protein B0H17DRAFT_1091602 [Mycena rosella]|uniref:Uncharacterized protein n=1 Tax=Mycena rosella TaxID=1033263 RepID=A0AAD7CVA7_MYCRO|nr:hypothetical protein B0H17DRAFT_1091602 [Mycena rosella]